MISSWGIIHNKVKDDIALIFKNTDIDSLSFNNKRKMIYDYVVNNFNIDTYLEDSIKYAKKIGARGFIKNADELKKTAFDHLGLSFGISLYYKLLLEEVGIPSYQVSYKYEDEKYLLNLILNDNNNKEIIFDDDVNEYCFDDVFSAIKYRQNDKYFNYNLDTANKYGQGVEYLNDSMCWYIIDERYLCRCLYEVKKSFSKVNNKLISNFNNATTFLNHNKKYYDANIYEHHVKIRGR